jgi:hypothetical protein
VAADDDLVALAERGHVRGAAAVRVVGGGGREAGGGAEVGLDHGRLPLRVGLVEHLGEAAAGAELVRGHLLVPDLGSSI